MSRLGSCSFVAVAALVATLALGCSPVTQLLVVVRSDLPASDVAEVHIEVVPGEPFTSAPTTRQIVIGDAAGQFALPFSFGILPRGGDASSRIEIRVSAIGDAGAVTVSRLVRTGFSGGRTLAVPVFLGAACRDRRCEGGLTCVDGACVSPEVPVEELMPVRPGEELGDASRPSAPDAGTGASDTGVAPVSGFAPPSTASGRDVNALGIVRNILVHPSGDLIVVVDATGEAMSFGEPRTLRPSPVTVVARLTPSLATRWVYVVEAESYSPGAALSGDRLFVCGAFDGILTPDGLEAMGSPDDGMIDFDDAAYLLELDADAGRARSIVRLASGSGVSCNEAVVSGSTLALTMELSDGTLIADSTLFQLVGCAAPESALARFDLTGGGLRPIESPTFGRVLQGGITAVAAGAGGYFVGLASDGSGDESLTGRCSAGGPHRSADIVMVDGAGVRGWGRHLVEVPDGGVVIMGLSLVVSGDRVVAVANLDAADSVPFSITRDGAGVSGIGATPRLVWGSLRASDGSDGRLEITNGSVAATVLVARAPDVALCGQSPWYVRSGFSSDLFGLSPPTAEERGFVVAIGPTGSARWLETTSVDGGISACTPDPDGGLWVAPFFLDAGELRGVRVTGSAIVHLVP